MDRTADFAVEEDELIRKLRTLDVDLKRYFDVVARAPKQAAERLMMELKDLVQELAASTRRTAARATEAGPVDLSNKLVEADALLRRLAGSQVVVSLHACNSSTRVRFEESALNQLFGHIAAHARETLSRGGRLTVETLRLEVEAGGTPWHPDLPSGRWVLLQATEAAAPQVAAALRLVPPGERPAADVADPELTAIAALVRENGGRFSADPTPGGGKRVKIYLPHVESAARPAQNPRELLRAS